MSIGTRHRVVNSLADFKFLNAAGVETTTKAAVETILIPGLATLRKANLKAGSVVKVPSSLGTKEVSTITIGGAASAIGRNSVSLQIDIRSFRNEAEFSRYSQHNGKKFSVGATVPANATAAQVATELKKQLDSFGATDLPFTYSLSGAVLTVTVKEPHLALGGAGISASDKEGNHGELTVATAVNTAGELPVGLGSQIEENVSFLTGHGALAGDMRADERVITSARYTEHALVQTFSDALAAMPKEQGANYGTSGETSFALFVNENLSGDPKLTLFESLLDASVDSWNA